MEDMERQRKERADEVGGISMPHDKGYKKSLQNPREFLHFLKKYVRADWMMELKESDLIPCDKEMLERDYEGKEADLIYRAQMQDGRETFIFILQELQSGIDHTMIFRILVYVVNTLMKHFLSTDKNERERAGFRLPSMVPIVFYNGAEKWTAVRSLKEYQNGGEVFGDYVLNLKYYLVELSEIGEEYILSTNTVLDNIMYCDKYRKRLELIMAIRKAYGRIGELGLQQQEEFRNWARRILVSVCGAKQAVAEEILSWSEDKEDDVAFQYNIVRVFEEERAENRAKGRAEGRAEGIAESRAEDILYLLEELGPVQESLREKIMTQRDMDILKQWFKLAVHSEMVEEFERQIDISSATF